jgi:hypothetical protein
MKLAAKRITDEDIRRAAIARGFEDASVTFHSDRYDRQREEWYILAVKVDGEFQVVGRRRTKTELLELAKR